MKMTEGLLKRTFEEIAKEYPEIQTSHVIIDNCAHQLVKKPEQFEVIVTTNMNGDIMSDLTSALVGGLGFAPSANLGTDVAIFEAVHGSAPKYAGKNNINPTAVILSGVMMLRHLGEFEAAAKIENSVLYTWEDGRARTRDVVGEVGAASTSAFTEAIINNFGKKPSTVPLRDHKPLKMPVLSGKIDPVQVKQRRVVGLDLFVESALQPEALGPSMEKLGEGTALKLKMISNRGTRVYPSTGTITDCVDQYRCRFVARAQGADLSDAEIMKLVTQVMPNHKWVHLEKLQEFDGAMAYTKAQGED
jgi:isocitrate dehydrogenase